MRTLVLAVVAAIALAGCSQKTPASGEDDAGGATPDPDASSPPSETEPEDEAPPAEGQEEEEEEEESSGATPKHGTAVFDWTFTGTDPSRSPTGTNCGFLLGNTTYLGGTLTARLQEGFTPGLRMRFYGPDGAISEGTGAGSIDMEIPRTNTTWDEPAQIIIHLERAGSEPVAAHVKIEAKFDYLGQKPAYDTSPTHISSCTLTS